MDVKKQTYSIVIEMLNHVTIPYNLLILLLVSSSIATSNFTRNTTETLCQCGVWYVSTTSKCVEFFHAKRK